MAAINAVAEKLGVGAAETVRKWVRQAEVDAGQRVGVTSEGSAEIKRLRQEMAELRRPLVGDGRIEVSLAAADGNDDTVDLVHIRILRTDAPASSADWTRWVSPNLVTTRTSHCRELGPRPAAAARSRHIR